MRQLWLNHVSLIRSSLGRTYAKDSGMPRHWASTCAKLSDTVCVPGELRLAPHAPSPGWKHLIIIFIIIIIIVITVCVPEMALQAPVQACVLALWTVVLSFRRV